MVNIAGMKMFAEFLGTFILAASIEFMTVYDQGGQQNLLIAILAGFFVAITLTRAISGGHINPAVTVAIYLAEQDEKEKLDQGNQMWMYVVAQTMGGVAAGLLGMLLYEENIFKLLPHPQSYSSEAFVLEILGSAVFFSIILIQGDKDAHLCNDKTISTLVITSGLATGIGISGNVSGACLNPALGFGFNFCRLLTTGKIEECRFLWGYILGPLCGSFFASYFYINVYRKFFEIENSDEKKKRLIEADQNEIPLNDHEH
jgi:glycerol uptake facilitator-like aquaporin